MRDLCEVFRRYWVTCIFRDGLAPKKSAGEVAWIPLDSYAGQYCIYKHIVSFLPIEIHLYLSIFHHRDIKCSSNVVLYNG